MLVGFQLWQKSPEFWWSCCPQNHETVCSPSQSIRHLYQSDWPDPSWESHLKLTHAGNSECYKLWVFTERVSFPLECVNNNQSHWCSHLWWVRTEQLTICPRCIFFSLLVENRIKNKITHPGRTCQLHKEGPSVLEQQ